MRSPSTRSTPSPKRVAPPSSRLDSPAVSRRPMSHACWCCGRIFSASMSRCDATTGPDQGLDVDALAMVRALIPADARVRGSGVAHTDETDHIFVHDFVAASFDRRLPGRARRAPACAVQRRCRRAPPGRTADRHARRVLLRHHHRNHPRAGGAGPTSPSWRRWPKSSPHPCSPIPS